MTETTLVERLEPILRRGDLAAGRDLLDGLHGDDLRAARTWFARNRRWFVESLTQMHFDGEDHDERFRNHNAAWWIAGMCAVRLAGPTTAAQRVPWRMYWDYREDPGEAALVHLLWDTDRDWAATFVEAASHVRLGPSARNCQEQLARILRAVALHHGLPCPTGSTFIDRWWAGTGQDPRQADTLTDLLATDPFMPDLLPRYLASGNCGDLPALPEAVAGLVDRGVVDRTDVVEHLLEALTAPQRPKSQEVLARTTTRLGLTAEEVPGGLTYLLGVLATAHRSVVPNLLPVAIDAVTGPADLAELARVVAARPEKQPRAMLLAALKDEGRTTAFGRDGSLAALELLRTGEDAAFDAEVDRAAAALGGTTEPHAPASTLGLWELTPTAPAPPPEDADPGSRVRPTWDDVLDAEFSDRARRQPLLVDRVLAEVADGTFAPEPLLASFRAHLDAGCLAVRSLAAVLEDLFLGGALRALWPTAVTMADDACATTTLPSGLADLLRLLGRYAPEVPGPWGVPPHLRNLARRRASTKAVAEARVLAAALLGIDEAQLDHHLADAPAPAPTRPATRGLWRVGPPRLPALPSNRRLVPPGGMEGLDDLGEARHRLRDELRSPADDVWGTYFTADPYASDRPGIWSADLALASVVRAIHSHGPDAVRAAVGEVERHTYLKPADVLVAVDVWAAGALDLAAFWRLATTASVQTEDEFVHQQRGDHGLDGSDAEQRRRALPPFPGRLRQPAREDEPLVVPRELASGAHRLHFLRAAEALLRAERHPVMLSTPTFADGTLTLDDLLDRLATVRSTPDATLGPVDLVQALHRLRPAEPERAAEVPDGPCTDPRFTHPDGRDSWDAGSLVRHWVAQGGLPELHPQLDGAKGWRTEAVAPLPFTRLAALPPDLRDDPWMPGPVAATARMLPLWPDRTVGDALARVEWFSEHLFPGHLATGGGLPLHDLLVAVLEADGVRHGGHDTRGAWMSAAEFAQRRRLVPRDLATAAVMRYRHGVLGLGALTYSLRLALEVPGAFSWWWVSAMSLADALCRADDPPAELAGLLRLLAAYAHEVPTDYLAAATPGIVALADSAGDGPAADGPADGTPAAAAELVHALAGPRWVRR